MFKKHQKFNDTWEKDNQAFIIYIRDKLNGEIPDYYRKTQGRINIKPLIDNNDNYRTLKIIIIILIVIIFIVIFIFVIIKIKKMRKMI